jgi:hypothetical protein
VPVRPHTIAKSLAIGNPADGYYAYRATKESNGWGEHATDEEIVEGMLLHPSWCASPGTGSRPPTRSTIASKPT